MKRLERCLKAVWLTAAAALFAAATHAGTIEDVLMRQKNGLWESTVAGGQKLLFCVTDSVKVGAQKQTLESMQQLGCKTMKDVVSGDDYEIRLDCASPTLGKFQMTMEGTVRSDYMTSRGSFVGGGELIQSLAADPNLKGEEWRWLRPCKANERPGLQE